jgi:hypothetical protein
VRILVNGATLTVERYKHSPHMGALLTPLCKNSPTRVAGWGIPFGIDNGATGKGGFEPDPFRRLLAKVAGVGRCLFVAAPDVVRRVGAREFHGDAVATLAQFDEWAAVIRSYGLPVALVGQDGLDRLAVPWDQMDGFFVGGSTRWKLGPGAFELCREAKRRGLHVHVGRVNSLRRINVARDMGADSIDGSHFTWWPDTHIPVGLRWVERVTRQGTMFGVTTDGGRT